jgi:hypothetical protein
MRTKLTAAEKTVIAYTVEQKDYLQQLLVSLCRSLLELHGS